MLEQLISPQFRQSMVAAVLGKMSQGGGMIMILLLGTLIFAAIVTFVRSGRTPWSLGGFWRHVWPKGTLAHPSARADILFWLSKRILMPPLILVLGFSTVAAGQTMYGLLGRIIPQKAHTDPAGAFVLIVFTLCMLVVYDFACWSYHYLQHRVPLMWEFHKVHHSAQVLVGVTKDRVHPVDEVLARVWTGMISGSVYAVWLYFWLDPAELLIFGMDAYALTNTVIMMDFVRHTHLKLSYGKWLNAVFIPPHYHQLHHSIDPKHYDQNFGQVLSVWDRMFGTLRVPHENEDFEYGLVDHEHDEYQSLARLYWVPIWKAVRVLRSARPRALAAASGEVK